MTARGTIHAVDVLLVEDDPGDVLLITEAFEEHRPGNTLYVVGDGAQALRFLRQDGEYIGAPRPGLIVLDLNLPGLKGLEILAEVKSDSGLLTIPVVVLTTSNAPDDIQASYFLRASAYITKPIELDMFTSAIRDIDTFYLTVATLPVPTA
jgi:two-component system response regulator